jgi:hypothetical protein
MDIYPFIVIIIFALPFIIIFLNIDIYIKDVWDLWYIKHFPHKIPFGQKWNLMLEHIEFEAWMERRLRELGYYNEDD